MFEKIKSTGTERRSKTYAVVYFFQEEKEKILEFTSEKKF